MVFPSDDYVGGSTLATVFVGGLIGLLSVVIAFGSIMALMYWCSRSTVGTALEEDPKDVASSKNQSDGTTTTLSSQEELSELRSEFLGKCQPWTVMTHEMNDHEMDLEEGGAASLLLTRQEVGDQTSAPTSQTTSCPSTSCAICCQSYQAGDSVVLSQQDRTCSTTLGSSPGGCSHVFHTDCLWQVLLSQAQQQKEQAAEPEPQPEMRLRFQYREGDSPFVTQSRRHSTSRTSNDPKEPALESSRTPSKSMMVVPCPLCRLDFVSVSTSSSS
uniref:Uncharacterized protein n=1 Tax=Entomoneis paludosa TaxID=265537 RepID=A0A7S2YKB6_9STRA|mmetsp:Transcript_36152/g.75202  ORF Transcript_36152/g.75202 Transcript_36152/m.75202 type:complete len:272 (+) Transcript_36152:64-879(+)